MTVVYFAGTEDETHFPVGACVVTTTAGRFRSAYSRSGLHAVGSQINANWWQSSIPYSATDFWFGAYMFAVQLASANGSTCVLVAFHDASNIVRLRLRTSNSVLPWTVTVEKIDAAGTATALGGTFLYGPNNVAPDKLDIHVNYAVAGGIDIYRAGVLVFTYSGDVTTNSVTALAGHRLYQAIASSVNGLVWSEIMVLDRDTRSLNLETKPPVANGTTHDFDTGTPAAANVNETTLSDTTLDGSTTAGQRDGYTVAALASGTVEVLAIGVSARMQKGASGPSKADLYVRSGGANYDSADATLVQAFAGYQNWWTTDPATGSAWTAAPTNIGVKSVT